MPRQLSQTLTRLVITGDDIAPNTCVCEYRVELGDLTERPIEYDEPAPDFTQTLDDLWAVTVSIVKSNESI